MPPPTPSPNPKQAQKQTAHKPSGKSFIPFSLILLRCFFFLLFLTTWSAFFTPRPLSRAIKFASLPLSCPSPTPPPHRAHALLPPSLLPLHLPSLKSYHASRHHQSSSPSAPTASPTETAAASQSRSQKSVAPSCPPRPTACNPRQYEDSPP